MTEELNDNQETTNQEKPKRIGRFKSKDFSLVQFQKVNGRLLVHSEEALFDAKYLSGMLDGVILKLTICDDNTLDLDEVDTNKTDEETLSRLVDTLFELPINQTHNGFYLNAIKFTSVKPYRDKIIDLSLKVDVSRPIDDMKDILNEKAEVSQEQLNSLNDVLGDLYTPEEIANLTKEKEVEEVEEVVDTESVEEVSSESDVATTTSTTPAVTPKPNTEVNSVSIEDTFDKIKNDKVAELNYRKERKEEEIAKLERINSSNTAKIEEYTEDLKNLNNRIEAMTPAKEPNGMFFNVSEEKDRTSTIDEATAETIFKAVSKVKNINANAFMEIFKSGKYVIKIGDENGEFINPQDVKNLELPEGVAYSYNNDELAYSGDLDWHGLVDKFIRLGYSQDPDFEKKCESNSYTSTTEAQSNQNVDTEEDSSSCSSGGECCGNGCHTEDKSGGVLDLPKPEKGNIDDKKTLLSRLKNLFK